MSAPEDPVFDRPVFIVSPPRSGSTLLFETLVKAPRVYSVGGESHALIETIAPLGLPARNFSSNRLLADDAQPEVAAELRARFLAQARDRNGARPSGRFRLIEKTPKNSLRIPFFHRVFPEARFVYLHRDPRQVLGSMIDAWLSGRFRTYLQLPGWPHPYWSLLLTPGWASLAGKPLPEIVAAQWEITTNLMLDDLQSLPPQQWHALRYDRLVADPPAEITRLCAALDFQWDMPLSGTLPVSRSATSLPDPEKWKRHAAAIERLLPALEPTIARAQRMVDARMVDAGMAG